VCAHTHIQNAFTLPPHTLPIYTSTSPVLNQAQRHQYPGYTCDKHSTQFLKPKHILEPQAKRRILKTTKQDYGHMQSARRTDRKMVRESVASETIARKWCQQNLLNHHALCAVSYSFISFAAI